MSSLLKFRLGLVLVIVIIPFLVNQASAMSVTMPYIVYPPSRPGAPWDKIKFLINVTGAETPINNITLFYSINETEPRIYTEVPMGLVYGDNITGTWVCEISPQKNDTKIYFYSSVIDSLGKDHTVTTSDQPARFEIVVYNPKFNILFFSIEAIDEKNLLADIRVTFDIYWPNDNEQVYVWVNNQNLGHRQLTIYSTRRFEFQEQLDIKGLKLNGDATEFPLDHYSLNLNFSVPFNATTRFSPKQILFGTFADYYIWKYSNDNKTYTGYFSIISVNTRIERKLMYASYYLLPLIVYAFVLGITFLLSSEEHFVTRLSVYLALFVFAWQFNNTIKDSVPTMAIGVTFAETLMNWLSYFTGIYIISTVFGNFMMKRTQLETKKTLFNVLVDGIAVIGISLIFFLLKVLKTPFFEKTLFECIPKNWGLIFYPGLIFGLVINLFSSYQKNKHMLMYLERTGVSAVNRRDYDQVDVVIASLENIGYKAIEKEKLGGEKAAKILGVVGIECVKNDMTRSIESAINSLGSLGILKFDKMQMEEKLNPILKEIIHSFNQMGTITKNDDTAFMTSKKLISFYKESLEKVSFDTCFGIIMSLENIGSNAIDNKLIKTARAITTDFGALGESTLKTKNLQLISLASVIISSLRILGIKAAKQELERTVTIVMSAYNRIMTEAIQHGLESIIKQAVDEMGMTSAEALNYDLRESLIWMLRTIEENGPDIARNNMEEATLSIISWSEIIGINLVHQMQHELLFKEVRKRMIDDIIRILNKIRLPASAHNLKKSVTAIDETLENIRKNLS